MKKAITLISALLMTFSASAQTKDSIDVSKFTVGYYFTTNTTDKDGNAVSDTLHTVLMVGNNVTKTMGYYTHKYRILEVDTKENYDEYQRENMAHVPTIIMSLSDKNMDVTEAVPASYYNYKEDGNLKWTLQDDTLTIANYLCHKAQTTYGGRAWYAYYSEDVPTTAGPWKLNGLPGLILKAEVGDGIFCFEMFELSQEAIAITKSMETANINTKRDKFVQYRNKLFLDKRYMEDPLYYWTRADNDNSGYEIYGTIEDYKRKHGGNNIVLVEDITYNINGIAVPRYVKTRTHYQPLELK